MSEITVGTRVSWQSTTNSPVKTGWVVAKFLPNRPVTTNGLPKRFRTWKKRFRMEETKSSQTEHYVVATQDGLLYHPYPKKIVVECEAPREHLGYLEVFKELTRKAREHGAIKHGNDAAVRRRKASNWGGKR